MKSESEYTALAPPSAFGFPDKFSSWREQQVNAVDKIISADCRFRALVCPTGSGKTLIGIAAAVLTGWRTLYLTSGKGLQSQIMRDFSSIGVVDVRGRNNYRCRELSDYSTCDRAPCMIGASFFCRTKESGGCDYYRALARARSSQLVVTNYAFWMASNKYSMGSIGKFDLIICDEGHHADSTVASFLTISLSRDDELVQKYLPGKGDCAAYSNMDWQRWANQIRPQVEGQLEVLAAQVKENGRGWVLKDYLRAKTFADAISRICNMSPDWIIDGSDSEQVNFAPIWPAPYVEDTLWIRVPRIVLTSATITKKTMGLLGIGAAEHIFAEYPSTFPAANRPLIHVPTIQLNYRTEADERSVRLWMLRIDQIINSRRDRKGIIHTVSYNRRNLLLKDSRHKDIMMSHSSRDTDRQVVLFKSLPPPRIMVSPSIATGYDFIGSEARFQIIGKLPYPNTKDLITKARCKADPDYGWYLAGQQVIQAVGRGVRSIDDWCESLVVDDAWVWFVKRHGDRMLTKWFMDGLRWERTVPEPMEAR